MKFVNKGKWLKQIQESSGIADLKVLLDLSLSEENKAVADYEARALKCERHGNTKAAKLFRELAKDERVHVAQLTEAKKLFDLNDPATDEEGSKEAKELLTEFSQKNEAPDPYKSSNYKYLKFKKNANGKTIMEAPAFDKVSSIVVHDRLFGEEVFLDNGYGSNGKLGNMVVRTARQMGLTIKDSSKNNNLWVYMNDNEIPAFYNRLDANIKEFI